MAGRTPKITIKYDTLPGGVTIIEQYNQNLLVIMVSLISEWLNSIQIISLKKESGFFF